MSDNKLVETLTDSATLTGLASGLEWVAKKVIKEPLTFGFSSNLINYVKFTVISVAFFAAKQYLKDQKILSS